MNHPGIFAKKEKKKPHFHLSNSPRRSTSEERFLLCIFFPFHGFLKLFSEILGLSADSMTGAFSGHHSVLPKSEDQYHL